MMKILIVFLVWPRRLGTMQGRFGIFSINYFVVNKNDFNIILSERSRLFLTHTHSAKFFLLRRLNDCRNNLKSTVLDELFTLLNRFVYRHIRIQLHNMRWRWIKGIPDSESYRKKFVRLCLNHASICFKTWSSGL